MQAHTPSKGAALVAPFGGVNCVAPKERTSIAMRACIVTALLPALGLAALPSAVDVRTFSSVIKGGLVEPGACMHVSARVCVTSFRVASDHCGFAFSRQFSARSTVFATFLHGKTAPCGSNGAMTVRVGGVVREGERVTKGCTATTLHLCCACRAPCHH